MGDVRLSDCFCHAKEAEPRKPGLFAKSSPAPASLQAQLARKRQRSSDCRQGNPVRLHYGGVLVRLNLRVHARCDKSSELGSLLIGTHGVG